MGSTNPAIIVLLLFSLSISVECRDFNTFVSLYKQNIEDFIMTGYGNGWQTCDIIAVHPLELIFFLDVPHVTIEREKLKILDVDRSLDTSAVAKAHCILVLARADNYATISSITEFGWTAIEHKRIGMMLQLGSNLTLDKLTNITKLPFLIAAQLENGEDQFLCPTIESYQPVLQQSMCRKDVADYRGKTIRVAVYTAAKPFGYMTEDGFGEGVDKRFINVVKRQFGFSTTEILFGDTLEGINSVFAQLGSGIQIMSFSLLLFKFQVHRRSVHLMILRTPYDLLPVDFLSHLGNWDFYPYSGTLRPIANYLTLANVCDRYTWIAITVTLISVCMALVAIEYCYASWNNHKTEHIFRNSKFIYFLSNQLIVWQILLLQAY